MKIMQRVIPAAVLAGVALFSAGAATAAPAAAREIAVRAPAASDNRNAALYYWRALYVMDRDFQREVADLLVADRKADWKPDEGTIAKLKNNGGFIRQLLQATEIDKCDFGIAYDEGFLALLPHLGPLRAGARILALDAHRLMAENRPDEAAERIAGIYRMSVHLRNDNVLISCLVGMAMASLAADEATMFAEAGKLTANGSALILAAMQPLNQADGFGVKRSIDMERRMMIGYMRRELTGPEAGKKLMKIGIFDVEPAQKEQLEALDEAAVSKDLDRMEVSYRDLLAAWDGPGYEKAMKDHEAKVTRGEYGLLAQVLTPAMSKAKSSDVKGAERVAAVIQTLSTAKKLQPAEAVPAAAK